jgi:hypothetical protein
MRHFTKGIALSLGWIKGNHCHPAYESETRVYFCERKDIEFCRQIYDKVFGGFIDASCGAIFDEVALMDPNLKVHPECKDVWVISDRKVLESKDW